MGEGSSLDATRSLYDYHGWANRRLFDVVARLGDETAARPIGAQFSFPTLRRMLAHLYESDWMWLERWKGTSPARLPGEEITSLAGLRERWNVLEQEQRAFLSQLTGADLARIVDYTNTAGHAFRLALGPLLQHVVNHSTHRRSELATMLTMTAGSPPPTDLVVYHLVTTGQRPP